MSRHIFCAMLLACLCSLASAQSVADEFTLNELLQHYTERYGGVRDANRLASISIEGTQVQGGEEFSFQIRKKRPSSIRYRLMNGNTRLTSIFNGRRGWLLTEQGSDKSVEELSGARLEILRREARFESPLYRHLEKPDNTIKLLGRERVGSVQTYVLRVEEEGVPASLYFLDPENAHILRIDQLDESGKVAFQTLYRDYREIEGYPFAHEIENRIGGETVSLSRVDRISVNPGLLSVYFENPAR